MANIEKANTNKNLVELKSELGNTGLETVYINGTPVGVIGYTGEEDHKASLDAIQKIVDSSDGLMDAMRKVALLGSLGEKKIEPDEQVTIEELEEEYLINYNKAEIYTLAGDKVADCEDLNGVKLPKEAVKALLIERAKTACLKEDE